jgi:macrolide transport system ATP-binding/permease protein
MSGLFQDIRYGLRMMRKRLGLTLLVIITLALGIGINSSIFNLVNAALRRPLPVDRPDELIVLYSTKHNVDGYSNISYPDYVDLRDQNNVFAGLIAYSVLPLNASEGEQGERIWGEIVTGNYFEMLGVKPVLGRAILPEDDKLSESHPVAVLSYNYWQRRFAGDPNIVGKTISLNGHTFDVIGVAPKEFHGIFYVGFSPALWLPVSMQQQAAPSSNSNILTTRDNRWLNVMGRLKPGVSPEQAEAAMQVQARQLEQAYPQTNKDIGLALFRELAARPEPESAGAISLAANLFLVLVGLVLLIASANVANMLLAQASARRREIALRLALGASRWRLLRQLLTESILLALLSGFVSLLLAMLASDALTLVKPPTDIPFELDLSLDRHVLVYTFVVSLIVGVLFGLLPALRLTKTELVTTLNAESGRGTGGKQKARLRNLLVIAQVAVSMVLLITGGLFIRSMQAAQQINPGFDTKNALLASVDLSLQGYDETRGRIFFRSLTDQLKTLPEVRSVTMASPIPLDFVSDSEDVFIEDRAAAPDQGRVTILRSIIGPNYFQTMSTPLLSGRDFAETDGPQTPKVVVINETMAKRYWAGQDAVGRRIRLGNSDGQVYQIVGIAKDGKYRTLGENPRPYMYLPFSQNYPQGYLTLVVRTTGDPTHLVPAIRQQVRALDPKLPVFELKSMNEHMARSLLSARMSAVFTTVFGFLALVLALTGLYGIIWYSVTLRTKEIGIRMALGAQQRDILKLVLKQGLGMALIGIVIGLLAAFAVGQVMSSLLYGVSAADALTFGSVVLLFIGCAFLASYFPARKAANIDPMVTLRAE